MKFQHNVNLKLQNFTHTQTQNYRISLKYTIHNARNAILYQPLKIWKG